MKGTPVPSIQGVPLPQNGVAPWVPDPCWEPELDA